MPGYESKRGKLVWERQVVPVFCTWMEEVSGIVTKTKKKGGIEL